MKIERQVVISKSSRMRPESAKRRRPQSAGQKRTVTLENSGDRFKVYTGSAKSNGKLLRRQRPKSAGVRRRDNARALVGNRPRRRARPSSAGRVRSATRPNSRLLEAGWNSTFAQSLNENRLILADTHEKDMQRMRDANEHGHQMLNDLRGAKKKKLRARPSSASAFGRIREMHRS